MNVFINIISFERILNDFNKVLLHAIFIFCGSIPFVYTLELIFTNKRTQSDFFIVFLKT